MLIPRQPVPQLTVATASEGSWVLHEQSLESFVMLVFYRGLHCPVGRRYLVDLNKMSSDFEDRGIGVLALSSDTKDRALQANSDWELDKIEVGYEFAVEEAHRWGLYVSTSRGKTSLGILEPDFFVEPGLFLIRPDMTLYASSIQTMPFVRPHFADVLAAVDFVLKNEYPARGEARIFPPST